jgi:hypothetical protein
LSQSLAEIFQIVRCDTYSGEIGSVAGEDRFPSGHVRAIADDGVQQGERCQR